MKYQYWLANILELYGAKQERALKCCGSAEELFHLSEKQMNLIYGLEEKDVGVLLESKKNWDLCGEYERFLEKHIGFVSKEMDNYPDKLKNIRNAPYALFFKGKLPDEERPAIAIVGARMCSDYGKAMAKSIACALAEREVQIISGMASGIDSFGHAGALMAEKDTYAVLGCGVEVCYPNSARNIYEKIQEKGGVLSEFPPDLKPQSHFFPMRNRILSGLSDVVIVIEARKKSGSLITADFALEQGKDIYVVPGRMTDPLSAGTNRLIRQGAGIIVSIEDLLKDLYLQTDKSGGKAQKTKNSLEKEESMVYSNLDLLPKNIDELMDETGLDVSSISAVLLKLQHKGMIEETFKNYYRLAY